MHDTLTVLIDHWKSDPHSTYNTWFLWEDRLKNFRSIRRGIGQVVRDIDAGTFGNAYRGSSLETVVGSVAEQRQIFKGADHAFLWNIEAIQRIDALQIKGLGPAVANLLYFIHPTLATPFNTAIVRGYNAVTGANVKLGRWDHYLSMREGLVRLNQTHRQQLSNDLGRWLV